MQQAAVKSRLVYTMMSMPSAYGISCNYYANSESVEHKIFGDIQSNIDRDTGVTSFAGIHKHNFLWPYRVPPEAEK